MIKWIHVLTQILAMAAQIYVPSLPLRDQTTHIVQSTLGFVQGVLGIIALAVDPNSGKGKLAGAAGLGVVLLLLCGAISLSTFRPARAPNRSALSPTSARVDRGDADRPRPFFNLTEVIL